MIWEKEARVLVQEVGNDDISNIQLDCYQPASTTTSSAAEEITDEYIARAYISHVRRDSQACLRVIIQKDDYEERKGLVKNA